jgi:hypothetical protein
MKTLLTLLVFCVPVSLFAQQNVKVVNGSGKEYISGAAGKVYNSALTAVTTSPTALTTITTKVQVIHCTNSSAGTVALTVKNGADVEYFTTVSMAANSVMVVQYGSVGLTYTSGIK